MRQNLDVKSYNKDNKLKFPLYIKTIYLFDILYVTNKKTRKCEWINNGKRKKERGRRRKSKK